MKASGVRETVLHLQRGVLRLALSFYGQHPELDNRLKKLGTLIRGEHKDEELQQLIDEIVDTIISQDLAQNPKQRAGRTLSDLVQRLAVRFPKALALKSIQQQLSMPLDSTSLERALEDTVNAVAEMVTKNAQQENKLDGLIKPDDGAVTRLLDSIDFRASADVEISAIKDRVRTCQTEAQLTHYVDEVAVIISGELSTKGDTEQFTHAREQLLLLMNLIPFPAGLTERSSKTRRSIEKAETAAALYGCIPEIADLTAAMRVQLQGEIDDLGEFLKHILARLYEFGSQIQKSSDCYEQSAENVFNLKTSMGEQGKGLRSDIIDEMDIASIKAAVTSHLDNIDERLGEFVQTEHERHTQAHERLDHMVNALSELESEAQELRENLQEQHQQVLIDPLTGILNRTGYDEKINKEFVRWRRYNSNLTVAVIDLDRFKDINDTYGHAAGDKVLTTVAQQIESQIRECDILCRYGGEEFVLLLPETSISDGIVLLEKLRNYIAQCCFHFQQTPVPVTISCGISEFHQDDSIEEVFDRADRAMYLSKRSGRNQSRSENELHEEFASKL